MDRTQKKALIAAYKERKRAAGIYSVTCTASGETWVGSSTTLDTLENRLWFTLRGGTNPHRSLQTAWKTHGADSFRFETLEQLKDDLRPMVQEQLLKERLAHWAGARGATVI